MNVNIIITYQIWKRSSILASLSYQTRARTHSHRPSYRDHAANVYIPLLALP